MSAVYALPYDVLLVREPIPVQDREGVRDELTPGYYVIVGQLSERLVLARAGEDDAGDTIACGPPFVIWAEWLSTEAVGITYLRAKRPGREYRICDEGGRKPCPALLPAR